jgi:hypothetical protein
MKNIPKVAIDVRIGDVIRNPLGTALYHVVMEKKPVMDGREIAFILDGGRTFSIESQEHVYVLTPERAPNETLEQAVKLSRPTFPRFQD